MSDNNKSHPGDLVPGVSESQLLEAVQKSGYPLQSVVCDILRPKFQVQEEWCFIDSDSQALRTTDLHASLELYERDSHPRVRPHLDMLVECKQSALPYVFFLGGNGPPALINPTVAGLHKDEIRITTDDDPSSWIYSVLRALGMHRDEFQHAAPTCNTFSKCVRKGSELELSGNEAYSSLILPLIKSVQHFTVLAKPPSTAWYFDSHFVVPVGVLDAPMFGVKVEKGAPKLERLHWVRVLRHEYIEASHRFERERMWTVDIVHKGFFKDYVEAHLVPFAERLSARVLAHQTEVATGEGFVPGMRASESREVESRLRPRAVQRSVARPLDVGRNLVSVALEKLRSRKGD